MCKIVTRCQPVGRSQLEERPQDEQIGNVRNEIFLILSVLMGHLLCTFLSASAFFGKLICRLLQLFPDGNTVRFALLNTFREYSEKQAVIASACPALKTAGICPARFYRTHSLHSISGATRSKDLVSPDSSMLLVAVPWAMSFRTLCFPCGTCRPRYALRIFRPTMPSTYASPRAVSLVVFTDMAIVRREISSSISYTASFLGTICLEVPSPIPTVFFLHLTVALQRRTVYDFLISGHLLPDRELREREHLMLLGNILQAVIHFHEMIAFFDNIAARGKMAVSWMQASRPYAS